MKEQAPKFLRRNLESKLNEKEIFDLMAKTCHETWVSQRFKYKQIVTEGNDLLVTSDDGERAFDAWQALKSHPNMTREEAVRLVSISSHNMWLRHGERDRKKKKLPPPEVLGLDPNDHDRERADDLIKALENAKVLEFK